MPAGTFREVYRVPEEGVLTIESFTTINGQTESTLQVQMKASCIQSNDDKYVRNLSTSVRARSMRSCHKNASPSSCRCTGSMTARHPTYLGVAVSCNAAINSTTTGSVVNIRHRPFVISIKSGSLLAAHWLPARELSRVRTAGLRQICVGVCVCTCILRC